AEPRAAGKGELRHGLIAAFGQRPRAIGEALTAREGSPHQRMRLEPLELLERRQIRVLVVEVNDEADRNQIFIEMIKERAAASAVVERPAKGVLHQAGVMLFWRHLPELLQPEAEFLRLAALRGAAPMPQPLR